MWYQFSLKDIVLFQHDILFYEFPIAAQVRQPFAGRDFRLVM